MSPTPGGSALLTRAGGTFAEEVTAYLQRTPKQLPSRFFYDALGSALFEAICRLPWYKVTRAERRLLEQHAREILVTMRHPLSIAELGGGSGEKFAVLASAAAERIQAAHLIDVSQAALDMASHRLKSDGFERVFVYRATYLEGLADAAARRAAGEALLVLFLGSNIGNFDPPVAHELLAGIRGHLAPGDALLLGADLVKPERELLLAYDDPLQVTAAFNRNLLRRVNDELAGTFDLGTFTHRAVWRPVEKRIDMHLVSTRRQRVTIGATGLEVAFEAGEPIWTESSHKYEPEDILELGRATGCGAGRQWIDQDARFALTRFIVGA